MNWYLEPLKKYAVFNGRACTTEYWVFALMNALICIGLTVVEVVTGIAPGTETSVLAGLYGLAVLIPAWAVSVRRLHDTNRSGWWLLIGLIPFVGGLIILVLMLLNSDPDDNRFGPIPIPRKTTTNIKAGSRKQFSGLGLSLVNNYQGRGINVGFGRGCGISDADLPAMGSLDLHELYLSRTGIGDESVAPLGAMEQLQVLDVSSTKISRDGIRQLKELLPDARIVG